MSDRDMKRHEVYMQMAAVQSLLSKDPSTAVGAVLLDHNGVVRGTGYNGFARGVQDHPERYANRETKLMLARHAEENCLSVAGADAEGGTLYSTAMPCARCASAIAQARVKRVVSPPASPAFAERWADSLYWSAVQMSEAGIEYIPLAFDAEAFVSHAKGKRGRFFPLTRFSVTTLYMTCDMFPNQFEGHTYDLKPVYIRYREGVLRMEVSGAVVYEQEAPVWVDSDGDIDYWVVRHMLQDTAVLPDVLSKKETR